jgi:hypothetical protein
MACHDIGYEMLLTGMVLGAAVSILTFFVWHWTH